MQSLIKYAIIYNEETVIFAYVCIYTCEEFKNNLEKIAREEITILNPLNNSLLFMSELNTKYHIKFPVNPTNTYI